jgi:hypothetical protein
MVVGLLGAMVSGCASPEGLTYRQAEKFDFGYGVGVSENRLGEKHYQIQSAGTSSEDDALLVGWLVRRATELCGSRKFDLKLALPRVAFHRPRTNGNFPDKWITGEVRCQ